MMLTTIIRLSAKVIELTGQDEGSFALHAIREGAFDVLAKPTQFGDIIAQISEGIHSVREDATGRLVR